MHIGTVSTLGGTAGRVTNHLVQGLIGLCGTNTDLFQLDHRREFDIDNDFYFREAYRPKIREISLAKLESIFRIVFRVIRIRFDSWHHIKDPFTLLNAFQEVSRKTRNLVFSYSRKKFA